MDFGVKVVKLYQNGTEENDCLHNQFSNCHQWINCVILHVEG